MKNHDFNYGLSRLKSKEARSAHRAEAGCRLQLDTDYRGSLL